MFVFPPTEENIRINSQVQPEHKPKCIRVVPNCIRIVLLHMKFVFDILLFLHILLPLIESAKKLLVEFVLYVFIMSETNNFAYYVNSNSNYVNISSCIHE